MDLTLSHYQSNRMNNIFNYKLLKDIIYCTHAILNTQMHVSSEHDRSIIIDIKHKTTSFFITQQIVQKEYKTHN